MWTRPDSFKIRPSGRIAVGLAVSAVALYLAAGRADWSAVPGYIGRASWPLVAAGTGVLLASLGLFALRWRALMPVPAAFPARRALSCLMVGYLANTVLPLRLGDAARLGLAARRSGLSLSLLMGTLAVERLVDITILAAAGVGLGLVVALPAVFGGGLVLLLGLALAGLTGLGLLALAGERFRVPNTGPGDGSLTATGRWVGRQLDGFRQGLAALRGPTRLGGAGGLSALAWAGVALATGLWVRAFGLPVPWYGVVLLVVAVNLGAAVPSAPAGLGVYHLAVILALSAWVADRDLALAYAVTSHGVNAALNVVVGLGCLVAEETGGLSRSGEVAKCHPGPG